MQETCVSLWYQVLVYCVTPIRDCEAGCELCVSHRLCLSVWQSVTIIASARGSLVVPLPGCQCHYASQVAADWAELRATCARLSVSAQRASVSRDCYHVVNAYANYWGVRSLRVGMPLSFNLLNVQMTISASCTERDEIFKFESFINFVNFLKYFKTPFLTFSMKFCILIIIHR